MGCRAQASQGKPGRNPKLIPKLGLQVQVDRTGGWPDLGCTFGALMTPPATLTLQAYSTRTGLAYVAYPSYGGVVWFILWRPTQIDKS